MEFNIDIWSLRFVGWGGRQGNDPMSVLHSVVNAKEELLNWITVTDVNDQFSIFNFNSQFNGDRRQRSRDLDGDVVQPPDLPARTLHHPQAEQDCRWKQDPELGHSCSEVPGREHHQHRLPGPVLQGLNN